MDSPCGLKRPSFPKTQLHDPRAVLDGAFGLGVCLPADPKAEFLFFREILEDAGLEHLAADFLGHEHAVLVDDERLDAPSAFAEEPARRSRGFRGVERVVLGIDPQEPRVSKKDAHEAGDKPALAPLLAEVHLRLLAGRRRVDHVACATIGANGCNLARIFQMMYVVPERLLVSGEGLELSRLDEPLRENVVGGAHEASGIGACDLHDRRPERLDVERHLLFDLGMVVSRRDIHVAALADGLDGRNLGVPAFKLLMHLFDGIPGKLEFLDLVDQHVLYRRLASRRSLPLVGHGRYDDTRSLPPHTTGEILVADVEEVLTVSKINLFTGPRETPLTVAR